LKQMAVYNGISVAISITSLERSLQRDLEPRTSTPANRLAAIRALADASIPVSVMIGPVIAGLNDHEIPMILKAAAEAGASGAGYVLLRLPFGIKALFEQWLENHRPLAKDKVLNAIRSTRGGSLNDPKFNSRMRGEGAIAEQIKQMFEISKRKYGLSVMRRTLSIEAFQRPGGQMALGF
jgi:DNA repair photolyase